MLNGETLAVGRKLGTRSSVETAIADVKAMVPVGYTPTPAEVERLRSEGHAPDALYQRAGDLLAGTINAALTVSAGSPREAAWHVGLGSRDPGAPVRAVLRPFVAGVGAVTADLAVYGLVPEGGLGDQAVGVTPVLLADVACVAGAGASGSVPASMAPRDDGDRWASACTVTATGALGAVVGVELVGVSAGSGVGLVSVFDRGPFVGLLVLAARGASSGASRVGVDALRWR